MNKISLILTWVIIFSIPQQCFGYDVKYLIQNSPAPFTGYLISTDTEKDFRIMNDELEYEKKINVSLKNVTKAYEDTNVVMQTRITNQETQIDHLTKKLGDSDSLFSKIGMFLLGSVVATAITFSVAKASR